MSAASPPPSKSSDGGVVVQHNTSFRDEHVSGKRFLWRKPKTNLVGSNLFCIEWEEGNRLKPKCFIDDSVCKTLGDRGKRLLL